jgi:hypothetical protein
MNVLWVSKGKPERPLTPEQKKAFTEANTLFVGSMIGTLVDRLQDVYLHHTDAKKLWDALEADYGGTDAGAELYIMEQYHDYKMTDGKSIVDQAHEIQYMAKELEHIKINLPDKFAAGGIIAKLPLSVFNRLPIEGYTQGGKFWVRRRRDQELEGARNTKLR